MKLVWDQVGQKVYETGVKKGVLYLIDPTDLTYKNGVAWNGLTQVSESPSGAEATKLYADDVLYLNMYSAEDRFMESDMLNIVALAGKENAILDAQIGTAIAKTHARQALNEANTFLSKKLATEITLNHCKLNDNNERTYYTPVCYASLTNEHNVQDEHVYINDMLPQERKSQLADKAGAANIPDMSAEEKENVDAYFQSMLNETNPTDEHAMRVKKLIAKLYSL